MSKKDENKPLNKKQSLFVDNYFIHNLNGTEAYMQTYNPKGGRDVARANASELLAKPNINKAIQERLNEYHMSADEALILRANVARSGLGEFFKVTDEWTFSPLATSEILDEKQVVDDSDPDNPIEKTSYRVRRVILDLEKILDPKYSRLIKKFTDTKNGLSIELYPADSAQQDILKVHEKLKDNPITVNMNWKDFIKNANAEPSDK